MKGHLNERNSLSYPPTPTQPFICCSEIPPVFVADRLGSRGYVELCTRLWFANTLLRTCEPAINDRLSSSVDDCAKHQVAQVGISSVKLRKLVDLWGLFQVVWANIVGYWWKSEHLMPPAASYASVETIYAQRRAEHVDFWTMHRWECRCCASWDFLYQVAQVGRFTKLIKTSSSI